MEAVRAIERMNIGEEEKDKNEMVGYESMRVVRRLFVCA